MDQSLDQLIAAKPKNVRRGSNRRGSARDQVLGKPTVSPVARARAAATPAQKAVVTPASQPTDKIIVSNLPQDVNELQIKELFRTTVGPLREVTLHYDSAGRSKGVAAVHFQHKGDGTKAYQQYNNRLIDGKSPMKIEIVVDPARPVPQSLASRVAPAAQATTNGAQTKPARNGTTVRGRRGARGRGGAKKSDRTPKSAADLDAEMEDYTASNAPAAATA
ncbi:hypothetical protein BD779DRAFT_1523636 [Infundibulicybe gibba]|nr:hypothetical protein BD779DRAFT_1523636 [Infundibulicybe gibba]